MHPPPSPTMQPTAARPSSFKDNLFFFALLLVIGFLLFRSMQTPAPLLPKGTPAPKFSLLQLHDTKPWKPQLRNKITVLHFWATWCPGCRRTLKAVSAHAEALHKQGIQYLLVSADMQMPTQTLKHFLHKSKIPKEQHRFHTLSPQAGHRFKIRSYPTDIVIGPQGKILANVAGGLSKARLQRLIKQLKSTLRS
ncbi:MAG: TlpA disulfide reductase family protein [Myxococcota bacterium]